MDPQHQKIKKNNRINCFFYILIFFPLIFFILINTVFCGPDRNQKILTPNVIVVVIDTLRADHLGCYGYHRPVSPNIDAFAKQAVRYTRCFASSPWTLPSHASLFTGQNPFEHGSHTFYFPKPENKLIENPLDDHYLTISEVFDEEGFQTAAFVANDVYLSTRFQFNQGFQTYFVNRLIASELNTHIFQWIRKNKKKNFFLFINYMDTHRPYNTTETPDFLDNPVFQNNNKLFDKLYREILPGKGKIPSRLVQELIDQFDTSITIVDKQFGSLIDHLVKLDLYENTIIILTSDHGEYFGEHYLVEHSKDIYQEALYIPLIIKYPNKTEQVTSTQMISSVDIPGMILNQFRTKIKGKYKKLFPNEPGNHTIISENYYTRGRDLFNNCWGHRFMRFRRALFEWPYKYIYSSDGKHELYDLGKDVKETSNLIGRFPDISASLHSKLQQFVESRKKSIKILNQTQLTEEEIRRLKSLGYL